MHPITKQGNNNELDDLELGKVEKEWRDSEPRLSDRNWFQIFPESRSYIKWKLRQYKREAKKLTTEIQKALKRIYKDIKDEFSSWFAEEIVRVWKGKRLNWLDKEITKWEWVLTPKEKGSEITDAMIERAREFPFKDLVATQRSFMLCPFHSERRPSFWIRNNWGYCFGCGWHGDTIKFVMDRYNLTFQEAIKYLA